MPERRTIISGCVSISAFSSLVGIPLSITSSAVGLKFFAITAVNEKYKLNNQKKGKSITK